MEDDRREFERSGTFWLIYFNDTEQLLGFIIELSLTGMRLWVKDIPDIHDKEFSILIKSPKELKIEKLKFDVIKVWSKPLNESNNIIDMGCKFVDLNNQELSNIKQLISFFDKQEDYFFNEIEGLVQDLQS